MMTLDQIIEAAYHCGQTVDEVHAAIAANGLDQASDETIMMLLGEYHDSIEG